MAENNSKNPIVETYKGIPIRKYPRIYMRVSIWEMKKFIDLKVDKGITEREAIKTQQVFCHPSTPFEVKDLKRKND